MKTPDWILEGFNSKAEWEKKHCINSRNKKKGKTFKVRRCPKCNNDAVKIILGGVEGKGSNGWKCGKCKWEGENVKEEELTESEFMKYLDNRGEEVA